jgi:integrase
MPSKTGLPGFVYRGISVVWNPARKRYEAKVPVGKRRDSKADRRQVAGKTPEVIKPKIAALLEGADKHTLPTPGRKPSVRAAFTMWLDDIAPYGEKPLSEGSIAGYKSMCENWLFGEHGTRAVDRLEVVDLDALYAKMYRAGLQATTVLKMHAVIRRGLNILRRRGIVTRNVADDRDNPGSTKGRRRKPLTRAQTEAFFDELARRPRRVRLRWQFGVARGPRQGEALGLRWAFVDWKRGGVGIDWQIRRHKWRHGCADAARCAQRNCRTELCPATWAHGCAAVDQCKGKPAYCPERVPATRWLHGCAAPGKCAAEPEDCPTARNARRCRFHRREACPPLCRPGCVDHAQYCPSRVGGGLVFTRTKAMHAHEDDEVTTEFVGMPESWMAELKVHLDEQEARRHDLGQAWLDHDLVFCGEFGQPIDPSADYRELAEILGAIGVPMSGTHMTRRTAARLMDEMGFNVSKIGRTLRQKDKRVTHGYIGDDDDDTVETARAMEEAFFRPRRAPVPTPPSPNSRAMPDGSVTPISRGEIYRRRKTG